jgi:hypothetical protein
MKENPASIKKRKKNLGQKNDDKNIIKYKKDIEDVVKHACYCCKTLCFTFQIHLHSKLYFTKLPNDLKNEKIEDLIFICNSCQKKIDCGKQLNMNLREHITNSQSNFKFVPILNKIEECLIAPLFAFIQIFQLKGYGQYGMHGNIVNISTKFNLVQTILL